MGKGTTVAPQAATTAAIAWQTRTALIDLYIERDAEPWYWRLLGALSAALVLLAFLIFPATFPTSATGTGRESSAISTMSVLAMILVALGYTLSIALWFICTSWLFQLDALFLPCLFSCVLGALNVVIAVGTGAVPPTDPWTVSAIALALVSAAVYGALSLLVWRKISTVRNHDAAADSDGETVGLLPEDEQQRQQLLRLLLQKENDRATSSAGQSTFHIDLPDPAAERSTGSAPVSLQPPPQIYRDVAALLPRRDSDESLSYAEHTRQTLQRARERSRANSTTAPNPVPTTAAQALDGDRVLGRDRRSGSWHSDIELERREVAPGELALAGASRW